MKTSNPIGPSARMRARIASAAAVCTNAVWLRPARMAPDGRATDPSSRLGRVCPPRVRRVRGARRGAERGQSVPARVRRVPRRRGRRRGREPGRALVRRRRGRATRRGGARARGRGRTDADGRRSRRVGRSRAERRRAATCRADLAVVPLGRAPGGARAVRRTLLHDRGQRCRAARRRRRDCAHLVGPPGDLSRRGGTGRGQVVLADVVHGRPSGGWRQRRRGEGARVRVARPDAARGRDHAAARDGAGLMLRIVRVLAPNPSVYTLDGTNTWVIGADPSIVVDPGPPDPGHVEQIQADAGEVSAVLVTHDHEDHGEGAVAFGELVGAPVYAWRLKGSTRLTDGGRLKCAPFLTGGVQLTAGAAELVAAAISGHSPDPVAFYTPPPRALVRRY